jgi:mannose-6-phosphate isomerase-like protein (cupin superfamily)
MTLIESAKAPPDGHVDGGASADAGRGFMDPVPLLTAGQRTLLLNHLAFSRRAKPVTWGKGGAVNDRLLFDMASQPRLLDMLRPLLGKDIILWGASTIHRKPGQLHAWHVDIESAAPDRRFASVWIGLSNTSRESGLTFVSRSHLFGKTIQEVQHEKQYRRGVAADEAVLSWARELDPRAELVQPDVKDGDALIFDGRIWHRSLNLRDAGVRLALLLQYSSADAPVFMPDPSQLEWPFTLVADKRPPVIVVSGKGREGINRQVRPPATGSRDAVQLTSEVRPIVLPLAGDPESGWKPHPLFRGATGIHDFLSCHVSVLNPGKVPHPPHAHIEEEILIVLDGTAELLIGDGPDVEKATPHPVGLGMFVYYPAYQHHTLRNSGSGPLTYLMFKWRGAPADIESRLATRIVDSADRAPKEPKAWLTWKLLEGPTNFLGKLHVHFSEVAPGGGYEPHGDAYDVAIVVLAGMIETLDLRVGPFGTVFYAAGELHGLRSVGSEPAKYLVFEFHAAKGAGRKRAKAREPVAKEKKPKKTLTARLKKLLMAPIRHYRKNH